MTPHDLLRRHPILGALRDGEARALLRSARCRMVAADEIVFLRLGEQQYLHNSAGAGRFIGGRSNCSSDCPRQREVRRDIFRCSFAHFAFP
jgi:hypothetical protein